MTALSTGASPAVPETSYLSPEAVISRLHTLATHPRRTLGALAVVLAAAGITVGSGANFTATSANPSNTFTAGTLTIGNSEASAILSAPNLTPGDTASGTVDIENTGSLAGAFTLSTSNASGSSSLAGQLDLEVEDCGAFSGSTAPTCSGATIRHTGTVSSLGSVSLGSFDSGEKHRYKFDVTLPSGTGDSFQGLTASVQFDWDAATA